MGGNYWTNSRKNGFSDLCEDKNNDGICDQNYTIGKEADSLPLTFLKDNIAPSITFEYPTPEGGSILYENKLNVIVKAEDNKKISYIEVSIYRDNEKLSSQRCTKTKICNVTFPFLDIGEYFFNATAYDVYNNFNSTETRMIIIRETQETFSYEKLLDYLPVAVITSLIVVLIKEVLDISVLFLKGVKK